MTLKLESSIISGDSSYIMYSLKSVGPRIELEELQH